LLLFFTPDTPCYVVPRSMVIDAPQEHLLAE